MSRQQGIEFLIKILGKEHVKQALDEVERDVKKAGDAGKDSAQKMDGISRALKGAASAAVGFFASFAAIGSVIGAMKSFYEWTVKIRDGL